MSNKQVIVDAASTPVCNTAKPAGIPIKIDTSQMQTALQALANQTAAGQIPGANEKINPSVFIKNLAQDMEDLYSRFDRLKILASELNGLTTDSPLPPTVTIKNITISFTVTKDGKATEHSAEIRNVAAIGDITGLMSSEFGLIISSLHNQSQQIEDLAKRTTERCGTALKDWEEKNKDRQIVRVDPNAAAATAPQATEQAGT